jgi:hypothetical protein
MDAAASAAAVQKTIEHQPRTHEQALGLLVIESGRAVIRPESLSG